jgi:hypothetical protein
MIMAEVRAFTETQNRRIARALAKDLRALAANPSRRDLEVARATYEASSGNSAIVPSEVVEFCDDLEEGAIIFVNTDETPGTVTFGDPEDILPNQEHHMSTSADDWSTMIAATKRRPDKNAPKPITRTRESIMASVFAGADEPSRRMGASINRGQTSTTFSDNTANEWTDMIRDRNGSKAAAPKDPNDVSHLLRDYSPQSLLRGPGDPFPEPHRSAGISESALARAREILGDDLARVARADLAGVATAIPFSRGPFGDFVFDRRLIEGAARERAAFSLLAEGLEFAPAEVDRRAGSEVVSAWFSFATSRGNRDTPRRTPPRNGPR